MGEMMAQQLIASATPVEAGRTGMLLLADNQDGFAARVLAARSAAVSLDLMYYLWHDDHTGRLLRQEVIKAADRGVRVRMLLDDFNPRANDSTYLALDSHPNISLRLFNPSKARGNRLARWLELITRHVAMTRRMHNKAWIADSTYAIIGGRNIGDAYFDAAETNFRDLDVLLLGKGVEQTAQIFESFWNCSAVKPIQSLHPLKPPRNATRASLAVAVDPSSPHLDRLRDFASMADFIAGHESMHWAEEATVISDPPEKAVGRRRKNWLMKTLLPLVQSGRETVEIISPYFVPGRKGASVLRSMTADGVKAVILTNSLAATDVAAVHGAYARYRRRLLRDGVQLFELQPYGGQPNISVFGSKGASLHTKAFTIDDRAGFIGSFNFDPRSVSLNTEMGIVFEHQGLVAELRRHFQLEISPQTSYRLELADGALCWEAEDDGRIVRYKHEPEASLSRRFIAAIVRLLPVESQL
jgi:putative cardiolipin synthase